MSKIEKALRRARDGRNLILVTPPQPPAAPSTDSAARQLEVSIPASSPATIARMRENRLLGKNVLLQHRIIHPELVSGGAVQAFREIRTKILQKTHGRNCVVMVSGVTAGSGGTFAALNIGAAFAFDAGKTALLIDCNLHNPALHGFLNDKLPGLTDYLESPDMDLSEVIHPVGIERLRIIPAGGNREIPGEYFTSARMKQLLESVRRRFSDRFVIIDAPPMTDAADTQILSELCDYVVAVVPFGKITQLQLDVCLKAVDSKKLLGVIFNNEPSLGAIPWREFLAGPVSWWRNLTIRLKNIGKTKST